MLVMQKIHAPQCFLPLLASALLIIPALGQTQVFDTAFAPAVDGPVNTVWVDPGGSFSVAGHFTQVDGNLVERLASFDPDGSVQAGNPSIDAPVHAMCRTPQGHYVAGGDFSNVAGLPLLRLARFQSDLSLDMSFANPQLRGAEGYGVYAVAVQSDSKVIAGGSFLSVAIDPTPPPVTVPRWRLARFHSDGSLDMGFLNPRLDATVYALAVQPDGKIIIGGSFTQIGSAQVSRQRLARLNTDGTPDETFADPQLNATVYALALQPDGKILVGGDFTLTAGMSRQRLARFNPDGSLDQSFLDPQVLDGTVAAIQLRTDGRVLAGGSFTAVQPTSGMPLSRQRLAQFRADGTLDTRFGDPNILVGAVHAIGLQDNAVLVGGSFQQVIGPGGVVDQAHLARFLDDAIFQDGFELVQ